METYESIAKGKDQPGLASLLMLFSIFAGAALNWTPQMLKKLNATRQAAKGAFTTYVRLAESILDNAQQPVPPSTIALAAISTLAHVSINAEGYSLKGQLLWSRCHFMARVMRIDRLDTARSWEERRRIGCNMIEIEIQRRIWWHMVASDWLLS